MSNSSFADVKLDTIQTLGFCLFNVFRPLPTLKEGTKRIFHWRTRSGWQISCFLWQGSMRNVIKQIHLSWNHQLSTLCFTDSPDLFSNSSPFYNDEMTASQTKKQNISLFSRVCLAGKYILILILRLRHGCLSRFRVKDIRQTNGLTVTDILAGLGGPGSLSDCWVLGSVAEIFSEM